ncbi:MAG: hypothetical protein ACI9QC_000218 [Oceanicoccus sp.]|jgi:hypothetical protein
MFNPLKYRYRATFVGEEESDVFLQVNNGGQHQMLRFPKNLLPAGLDPKAGLQIAVHPEEQQDSTDIETLKELLQALIG